MHNFYKILEVNPDASSQCIKKAYRGKALFEHPDKGGNAQKMSLLTKAIKPYAIQTKDGNLIKIGMCLMQ